MNYFRIAPDGALLDRVAEFTYANKPMIQTLYESDPTGYTDAVAKLVQILATSEKIVTGPRKTTPAATTRLKDVLREANRHENSTFFAPEIVEKRKKAAMRWLKDNWNSLIEELRNPDSAVSSAVLGHLRREFYMYWKKIDPTWEPLWYSEDRLPLPDDVAKGMIRAMAELARMENFPINEQEFRRWIEQNITIHFRIFGEYYRYMANETDDEYLPALTRSSLRFLTQKPRHGSVESLVMPFVGFAALKKVKHREGLIDTVVEWSWTEGKDIVDGMDRLQEIFRTAKDPEKRKKLLSEAEDVLTSKLSWQFRLAMNAIKIIADAAAKKPDVTSAENVAQIATSKSYRWLYRIRTPELEWQWRKRLEELLET
jgi:hypothetical protein